MKTKQSEGITLIALVITIIVLLILAGVAISMLSGENGILKKAAESKTKTEEGQKQEEKTLTDIEIDSHFIVNNSKYKCRYGYITGINRSQETIYELQQALPNGYFVMAKDGTDNYAYKNSNGDPIITTGMTIVKDGKIVARTIKFGEIDCDNRLSARDIDTFKKYMKDENTLIKEDYIKVVMDINCDGKINMNDFNLTKSYVLNQIEMSQSKYVSDPNKIIHEIESILRSDYSSKVNENDICTVEYNEKEDTYNLKMKTSEKKVEELLKILPEGSKIKRNEEEVATTENVQNDDKVIYVNEEKEIYIGKIIIE